MARCGPRCTPARVPTPRPTPPAGDWRRCCPYATDTAVMTVRVVAGGQDVGASSRAPRGSHLRSGPARRLLVQVRCARTRTTVDRADVAPRGRRPARAHAVGLVDAHRADAVEGARHQPVVLLTAEGPSPRDVPAADEVHDLVGGRGRLEQRVDERSGDLGAHVRHVGKVAVERPACGVFGWDLPRTGPPPSREDPRRMHSGWERVEVGTELPMYEGLRACGRGRVLWRVHAPLPVSPSQAARLRA